MNETVKNAIDFAFVNKVAEMGSEVESALFQKVSDAIMGKREEIARNLLQPEMQEEDFKSDLLSAAKSVSSRAKEVKPGQKEKEEDEIRAKRKEDIKKNPEKYSPQRRSDDYPLGGRDEKSGRSYNESFEDLDEDTINEMIAEALSADQGASAWIHDFVHSDDPKFKGKSEKERRQFALAAYYQAKREGQRSSMAAAIQKKKNR